MKQMNEMLESMVSQFDGQDQGFFISTPSGYEFMAYVKSPFNAQDNFSDFSNDERIIRYSFNIDVTGYILAPDHPGLNNPVRSYLSAPTIEFGYKQISAPVVSKAPKPGGDRNPNKFILEDIEDLNSSGEKPLLRGQSSEYIVDTIENPFSETKRPKLSKILIRNQRAGETVASANLVIDMETQSD